jgi:hypothetical protein
MEGRKEERKDTRKKFTQKVQKLKVHEKKYVE